MEVIKAIKLVEKQHPYAIKYKGIEEDEALQTVLSTIKKLPQLFLKEVRPKIICLCGSTRFIDTFAIMAWIFEKEGAITLGLHLLPRSYPNVQPNHQAEYEGIKEKLDELHLRKIDLADEVFIINKDGYIGQSTKNEIEYAKKQNKIINYLEPIE